MAYALSLRYYEVSGLTSHHARNYVLTTSTLDSVVETVTLALDDALTRRGGDQKMDEERNSQARVGHGGRGETAESSQNAVGDEKQGASKSKKRMKKESKSKNSRSDL